MISVCLCCACGNTYRRLCPLDVINRWVRLCVVSVFVPDANQGAPRGPPEPSGAAPVERGGPGQPSVAEPTRAWPRPTDPNRAWPLPLTGLGGAWLGLVGHGRAREGKERAWWGREGGGHGGSPPDPHTRALKHRQRKLDVEKCLGAGGFGIVLKVRDGHG